MSTSDENNWASYDMEPIDVDMEISSLTVGVDYRLALP